MDAAVESLFREYERAFDALDVERQVGLFADTFISAGPRGTIAQSRDELVRMAHQAADFYRSVGQTGARIVSMEELPISDHYSMVNVHWACTFEKTGDEPVEFDVTYFLQKTDPARPRIIMFVAHQDEEKAMQELGLLQSAGDVAGA